MIIVLVERLTKMILQKEIINVGQLSDCDDTTAFLMLKKYLIDDCLYSRKQDIHKDRKDKQFKYIDLFHILVPVTDKMYKSLSVEDRKNAKYSLKADRWKYIHVADIPRTFEMNPAFIKQASARGMCVAEVTNKTELISGCVSIIFFDSIAF